MADQLGKDNIEQSRQQLGYSQQLTDEIRLQENLAKKAADQYESFSDEIKETRNAAKDLTKSIKEQFEAIKQTEVITSKYYELKLKLNKAEADFEKALKKSKEINNSLSANAQQYAQQYLDGLTARFKIEEELTKEASKRAEVESLERDFARGIGTITNDMIEAAKEESLAQSSKVFLLTEQLKIVDSINQGNFDTLIGLNEQDKVLLLQFAHQQKILDINRNIENNHRETFNTLNSQLSTWDKIESKTKFYLEKVEKLKSTKVGKFLQAQALAVGLTFGAILKNLLEYDKTITDAAKQLGLSKDSLKSMASSMVAIANNAEKYNENAISTVLTIKNQLAAQQEINNSLGTANILTNQARVDQVVLTKQMGLQADEAAKLYKLGLLNEESAKGVAKTVAEEVVSSKQKNKFQFDYKTVLNDVAKVEGQLAAQYKNNPKLLAEAVIQVKELGIEFNQAAGMANKLLDFESSIASELKAELLTGKALNLEKARELALRGESAAAAKELMDNVGGLTEFQNLNVLQQRALADAIGLSADELANSLRQQQLLAGTAFQTEKAFKEQAEAAARQGKSQEFINSLKGAQNAEDLMAQAQQISNQEKFQMAVEKLKETFVTLVDGPFGKLIDGFANIMSNAKVINTLIGAMALTMGASLINNTLKMASAIRAAVKAEKSLAAAKAVSLALSNPLMALAAVATAGLAAYAISNMLGGGVEGISASGGGGINTNLTTTPTQTQSSQNNNSNKPIVINLDNRFQMGGRDIASSNTVIQSNNSPLDKTS